MTLLLVQKPGGHSFIRPGAGVHNARKEIDGFQPIRRSLLVPGCIAASIATANNDDTNFMTAPMMRVIARSK